MEFQIELKEIEIQKMQDENGNDFLQGHYVGEPIYATGKLCGDCDGCDHSKECDDITEILYQNRDYPFNSLEVRQEWEKERKRRER